MNEEEQLTRALALDDDELAFLRAASLPLQLAARLTAERRVFGRALALDLLWVVVPAALCYVGLLVAAPLAASVLALAGQAGATSLLAAQAMRGAWTVVDGLASTVEAASALPGFNAPLVLISLLAAATYVVSLTEPRVRRQTVGV